METDKIATERVLKARAELILAHTFYGVLISQVAPKPSRQVPTMATDGRTHFFNPDFIGTLSQNELLGVQRHESEHDARRHHTRRGYRDQKEWNIACDYAINIDLIDEGVTLPANALIDPKYRGWSAEDIYRARELDRQQAEKQRQQQQQQDAEDDDADDENGQDPAGDQDGDQDDGEEASDQDGGEEAGDQGEADGQDDGEEAGDQGEDGGQGGQGEDGDQDGGQGEGAGEAAGEPTDGQGQDSGQGDGGDQEGAGGEGEAGKPGETCGDPGGCGEVLDAAEDSAGLSDADSNWERILRQAASLAAKRGTAPGHITREIERADKQPQDWRETLRAYFDAGCVSRETWSRPNRRFAGAGLYLPGREREGINKVCFLIDTSGSMDQIALACIATEVQAALDEGVIDEAIVVYGDTRVTRVDTYRLSDEVEFDPRGGGGTDLKPLFAHVAEEIDDASLIVCFTDGYIGDAGPQPACPVLWAYTGYPDAVRQMIATAPWGADGIDVGSH
jgi:predicted metal-dependent peptidase